MSIGIKKLIKVALMVCLMLLIVCLINACQSKAVKVDRQSYNEHSDQYIKDIQKFLESDSCKNKYTDIKYDESEGYEAYYKTIQITINEYSTIFIYFHHVNDNEIFSVSCDMFLDEYGPGKSCIDMDLVAGITNIVSGYDFSKEQLSSFVENALEKNTVCYKSYRDAYLIYDHKSLNFMMDWNMCYSIQKYNGTGDNQPRPPYYAEFYVGGLTKAGTTKQ